MTSLPRFDEAWEAACDLARLAARDGRDVVLVRDLSGQSTLLVDDRADAEPLDPESEAVVSLREGFASKVRPFAGDDPVQTASSLFVPEMFFGAAELIVLEEREQDGPGQVAVLERTVVGGDWAAVGAEVEQQPARQTRRLAFYGFKGGVGRSTATTVLARNLAERGHCVLVVDLDLESPGVSNLLAEPGATPPHGIVDHLVESAVGNADGLELVSRSSILPPEQGNGEVWLAPAAGTPLAGRPYDYLAKLNRIYSDLPADEPGGTPRPFAQRLEDAIAACEAQVEEKGRRPDVVLLDSRAGIHDIAAVTLTKLCDQALLFAVDNPSTWDGYRMLLSQWKLRPDRARALRDRVRVVAAMFHSAGDIDRLNTLRRHAYDVFMDTLYNLPDDEYEEPFLPVKGEVDDKPYAPIPILFGNDLVGLDPLRSRNWPELPFVRAAYREFVDTVEKLVLDPYEDKS
ncbi:KGGVGR-motif variant AAA ATPase [Streptomyces flavochromogenes]|uniref:KGGVGR-motif variant AAA ATPase n=1 Tax=Streptomyces flavochromogenes TaxID=68199 RepID=UPI0004C1DB81|nr:P-loop NTPase [Streptomyces flavochromogenes]